MKLYNIALIALLSTNNIFAADIKDCNNINNRPDETKCVIENAASTYSNNCISKEELISHLQYLQVTLRQKNYRVVDAHLTNMLYALNNCQ